MMVGRGKRRRGGGGGDGTEVVGMQGQGRGTVTCMTLVIRPHRIYDNLNICACFVHLLNS